MAKDYQYYFSQLRRIEDHREQQAEKEIRKLYRKILKETRQFIAEEYYQLAEDGKLTFEILRSKSMDARFLQEVEQRLGDLSIDVSREIKRTVEEMYQLSYDGIRNAVEKGKDSKELQAFFQGVDTATAQTAWASVDNTIMDVALEKNHKNIIWDIKREVATALTVGDRFDTMADRIVGKLNGNYKKAILIARTEVGRVREAGHLASAKNLNDALQEGSSGMRMVKKWMTMRDGSVRDTHSRMNGVVVEMDDPFILPSGVKTMAPKQSGVAAEDCNCRCYVSYQLMDDEEFFKATGKHFSGNVLKTDEDSSKMEAEKFVPAKTIKEAEQYAKSSLGIECSYKGVDIQCANEMNAAFKRGIDYCPAIRNRLKFVGSGQERNKRFKKEMTDFYLNDLKTRYPGQSDAWYSKYAKSFANKTVGRIDGNTYAFASGRKPSTNDIVNKYSGIVINNKWGENPEAFIKSLKRCVEVKWHPESCDTIASVFDHEVAHQIDYATGIRDNKELKDLWGSMSKSEIKEGLSEYGASSIAEFIAEGYSEFVNSSNPRKIARKIGEIIEKAVKQS